MAKLFLNSFLTRSRRRGNPRDGRRPATDAVACGYGLNDLRKGFPMIIFGTRTLRSTRESGSFNCPRCSMQRTYQRISANRYFTLYFIPLIPMGSAGEYVECLSCGGTYGVEVLSYNPEVEQAELKTSLRRALVLVLVETRRGEAGHVARLVSICEELFGDSVSEQQIWEDLRLTSEANAQLVPFVQQRLSNLSSEGKVLLMQAAVRAISTSGFLHMDDKDVIGQLGRALGVPQKTVKQILDDTGR